ncbi:Xylose isomerase-like TIM barrel [Pelosinus fermentans]|uniref:Xylose isomerase domain-containing protein TIM barrel n=1 Tax=Pelosinus fermentans B4 TaxID=1149862 RepID=I9B1R8_9FIRM|nr:MULTISPECIES: TIM barrel protein [Pelosinus]EIW19097.1 Xylose isomerase domain-containing protein TIM barrel [Pelosinus fermentans B4]OAM95459.1 Xylose isomerase domain-containing protein TIM barrel [Pelosinus fermentans DSM 17108]SDR28332.1 Xylose isomerase-like TIM barrel [Pelosinus fermentans]
MLQLVNLSNYASDLELIHNNPVCLEAFLNHHHLDGLEMMFCDSWNPRVHKKQWIQGVHLRFWPNWLDFWRGDREELLRQFGSDAQIEACYGALTREGWLNVYRENLRIAKMAGAKYVVFHVSQTRIPELFHWQFSFSDRQIIEATIEVINELAQSIPGDMELLFENLWWPGLTLKDKELTALLLDSVKHPKAGIMLDIGHLMNTNPELKDQDDGVDYVLKIVDNLEEYKHYIHGVHLHHSLSGNYIKQSRGTAMPQEDILAAAMSHVLRIDEHLPFSSPCVKKIINSVQPTYVVHEFMYTSINDWSEKIRIQQQALQYKER